jgi:hypothetical protein
MRSFAVLACLLLFVSPSYGFLQALIGGVNLARTLLYKQNTKTMQGIIDDPGFKRVVAQMTYSNSRGVPSALVQRIFAAGTRFLFPRLNTGAMEAKDRQVLLDALELAELHVLFESDGHEFVDFGIQFKEKTGKVQFIKLHLGKQPCNNAEQDWSACPAKYDVYSAQLQGEFEKAPSFIVVHSAKSSFFSHKEKIEFKPLDRGVTETDIARFFALVGPRVAAVKPPDLPPYSPLQMQEITNGRGPDPPNSVPTVAELPNIGGAETAGEVAGDAPAVGFNDQVEEFPIEELYESEAEYWQDIGVEMPEDDEFDDFEGDFDEDVEEEIFG